MSDVNYIFPSAFELVETDGLRVEIQLQDKWSAGIIELKINK